MHLCKSKASTLNQSLSWFKFFGNTRFHITLVQATNTMLETEAERDFYEIELTLRKYTFKTSTFLMDKDKDKDKDQ